MPKERALTRYLSVNAYVHCQTGSEGSDGKPQVPAVSMTVTHHKGLVDPKLKRLDPSELFAPLVFAILALQCVLQLLLQLGSCCKQRLSIASC